MKKIIVLAGIMILALNGFAQNAWQPDGNIVVRPNPIIGTKNNRPLYFTTNNQTHAVLDVNGNFEMYNNLRVRDTLKVGDNSFQIYENANSQGGLFQSDYLTSTWGRICFGNNALPPSLSDVSVGIGGSHYAYKVQIEDQTERAAALLGFTNSLTTHLFGNGFTVGLPTTGEIAELNQQEKAPILFRSNNIPRFTIEQETAVTDRTRVSIHSIIYNPVIPTVAMLNIGDPAHVFPWQPGNGGQRSWMNTGIFICESSDNMYIGLRYNGFNQNEAIINWGNDPTGQVSVDKLRFVFTSYQGGGVPGSLLSSSQNGLEIARMVSNGNNGRMGIGNFFTPNVDPVNTLEIRSDVASNILNPLTATGPTRSGLRFTNLNATMATDATSNSSSTVLSVNNNGDVILVSGGGAMDHDWYTVGTTTAPMNINDNKYTFGNIAIGANQPSFSSRLYVYNDDQKHALYLDSRIDDLTTGHYGVYSSLTNDSREAFAFWGLASGGIVQNIGIWVSASSSPGATNYGICASVAHASGGSPNDVAGQFNGDIEHTGNIVFISDSSLKENIISIDNALYTISHLNPKQFNFKNTPYLALPSGNQYGVIAQDAEEILPELVREIRIPEEKDSTGYVINPSQTYKGFNYTGLIPILAQGIKELDAKTDSIAAIPAEADNDWAHIPGAGILSGYTNNDGINSENVYIGFQPTEIPTLAMPVKMAILADQGGIGTNNEFGLVTGGFRNMMVHSDSPNSTTHAYGVFSESMGDGCNIRTSANYGLRAQADNAKNNYGGYFRAYAQNICSRNNYAVYADCPVDETKNNYAGYFNGNLAYTGNLSFQSDIMLKENVVPVANAIDILNQLNPVSFNFKTAQFPTMNMPAGNHFGLIAQEVEPVIPEVVSSNFFPAQYDDNGAMLSDTFSYKSIDYTKLIPHMIEAIKELSQQNQDLQNQVTQMQDIIASCCNEARNSIVNVTIETRPVVVPAQNTTLNQNYPNPFKTITTFTYTLGESGNCELIIEDTYGRTVATLVSEPQQTGNYSVEWEASSQPAGIYFYSLRVNGKVLVKKAIKIE